MREEEKKQSSQKLNLSKFLKKRWVFPAVYLIGAALLITMIFWFQSTKDVADPPNVTDEGNGLTGVTNEGPVIEVNQALESVTMPVEKEDNVNIVTQFFDGSAPIDEQEAALIVDGNKYRPSMGIDIAMKDETEFEVLASLSGKVKTVREDSLLGNVVEIEHDKGIVTVYQSVKDIQVKEGDMVKQGQVLATSNRNQLNKEAKNHVHFEIRKDNTALNPLDFFGQPFTALEEIKDETELPAQQEAEEESTTETEQKQMLEENDDAETSVEE